tara:strand:+ start:8707 stop:8889 length:183 start_codon:yes stop_codon:yes gene_type:complete
MDIQKKIEELSLERQKLTVVLHELTGAIKILEQQLIEQSETVEQKEIVLQDTEETEAKAQ